MSIYNFHRVDKSWRSSHIANDYGLNPKHIRLSAYQLQPVTLIFLNSIIRWSTTPLGSHTYVKKLQQTKSSLRTSGSTHAGHRTRTAPNPTLGQFSLPQVFFCFVLCRYVGQVPTSIVMQCLLFLRTYL